WPPEPGHGASNSFHQRSNHRFAVFLTLMSARPSNLLERRTRMVTNPAAAEQRSPPALSAVVLEQLSFLRACLSNGPLPVVLYATVALPIIPFLLLNRGYPLTRGYAAFVLLSMCCALPVALWQHRHGKGKGGDAYFLSLPVERRWHTAARAAAGWPPLMAAGVVLLTLAFVGGGADGVPAHGWLATLLGTTALYLITSGLSVRARQPALFIAALMYLTGMTMARGPEVDESILPFLESLVIALMGS